MKVHSKSRSLETVMLVALAGLAIAAPAAVAQEQPVVQAAASQLKSVQQSDSEEGRNLGEMLVGDETIAQSGPTPETTSVVRNVRLNTAALKLAGVGDTFDITPEPGQTFTFTVTSVESQRSNVRIVRAKIDGAIWSDVTFATYDDATAMVLKVAPMKLLYRLQNAGNGAYYVWKIDEGAQPDCEGSPPIPPSPPLIRDVNDDDYVPPMPDEGFGARDDVPSSGGCTQSTPIIDHMVVYTPAARDACGGTTAIRAEAVLAVDLTNQAYANSAVSTRARLVYCNLVTYTEGATMNDDLDALTNSDGVIDGVISTRDTINADQVVMYTNTGSGLGWCPSGSPSYNSGNCVGAWWRVAGTYTHAHETGHNLGAGHSRQEVDPGCGPSYSKGWRYIGNDGNGYCTTMAYSNSSYARVLYYSNPNVSFQGQPTGNAIGTTNEAFNARVIADNDNTVSGHETTRYDIYVDTAFGGFPIEVGMYAFPYNTLSEGVAAIQVPSVGAAESPSLYLKGNSTYVGTISKEMWLRTCNGPVTIGG